MNIGMMLKLTQVQLERYFTSVSDHPTNQIVQNLTLGIEFDWIKLHSNASYPGSLGPGIARISGLPISQVMHLQCHV